MTPLELALIQHVQEQQQEIQELRRNQLQVSEDADMVVVSYKGKIILKSKIEE